MSVEDCALQVARKGARRGAEGTIDSFGGDHFSVRWIVPLRPPVEAESLDGSVDGGIRMLAKRSESRDFPSFELDGHGAHHADRNVAWTSHDPTRVRHSGRDRCPDL